MQLYPIRIKSLPHSLALDVHTYERTYLPSVDGGVKGNEGICSGRHGGEGSELNSSIKFDERLSPHYLIKLHK